MNNHRKRTDTVVDQDDNEQRKRTRIEPVLPGKVYIASMNLRGKWAPKPADVDQVLNVTSAQSKTSINRLTFSPMTPVPGGYKGFWNFEHYWQSGKVFEGVDPRVSQRWWREQNSPRRRYPGGKGKRVLHAIFEDISDEPLDYLRSRKLVYVPQYAELIEKREALAYWRSQVLMGKNVIIYDFDGPRLENGDVTSELCSLELFRSKINDTRHPFGHGVCRVCLTRKRNVAVGTPLKSSSPWYFQPLVILPLSLRTQDMSGTFDSASIRADSTTSIPIIEEELPLTTSSAVAVWPNSTGDPRATEIMKSSCEPTAAPTSEDTNLSASDGIVDSSSTPQTGDNFWICACENNSQRTMSEPECQRCRNKNPREKRIACLRCEYIVPMGCVHCPQCLTGVIPRVRPGELPHDTFDMKSLLSDIGIQVQKGCEDPLPKITDFDSPGAFLEAAGIETPHDIAEQRMNMEKTAMDVRRFLGTLFGEDEQPTSAEGSLEGWTNCLKISHWACKQPKHIVLVEQGNILDSTLKIFTRDILSALASVKTYPGKMATFFVRTKGLSVEGDKCSIAFAVSGKPEKEQKCKDKKLAVERKIHNLECHTIVVPTRSMTGQTREVPSQDSSHSWLDWNELCLRLVHGLRDESTSEGLITAIAPILQIKEDALRRFAKEIRTLLRSDAFVQKSKSVACDSKLVRFVTGTPRDVDMAANALLDVLNLHIEPSFAFFQNGCAVGIDYRGRHEADVVLATKSFKDDLYGHLTRDVKAVAGMFRQCWNRAVSDGNLPAIAAALGHCGEDNLFHHLFNNKSLVSDDSYDLHIFFSARVPMEASTSDTSKSIRIYPPCGVCHNHIHSDLQELYKEFHMEEADRHVEAHMPMDYSYVGTPMLGTLVCRYRNNCQTRHYRLLPSTKYPCEESMMNYSPGSITRMVRVLSYNDDRHVGIPIQLDAEMDKLIEKGSHYYVQFCCKPVDFLMLHRHKHEGCCAAASPEASLSGLEYQSFRFEESRILKHQALLANRKGQFLRAIQLCDRALKPLYLLNEGRLHLSSRDSLLLTDSMLTRTPVNNPQIANEIKNITDIKEKSQKEELVE